MCRRKPEYQPDSTSLSRFVWPFLVIALAIGNLFASAQPAAAVLLTPTACRTDLKGVDQSKGGTDDQGDLTQFCLAAGTSPYDFYASWSWDNPSFGSQSGDGCLLFDSGTDGLVDYAVCVTVTGTGTLSQTSLYSCNNTRPENCDSAQLITTTVNTTCETSVQSNDPFKPGQQDTVAVCGVALSDFNASGLTLIDACSYTSSSPSSDARDCILFTPCTQDIDCNDNDTCTTDTCDTTLTVPACRFTPSTPGTCSDACTADGTCDPSGFCQGGNPVSCDDHSTCTDDSCSPATGCVTADNGSCPADPCADVTTDDGDACTTDSCDSTTGVVSHTPVDTDDGDACTTDSCDSTTGVSHTPVNTDDGNVCTTDTCDAVTGVHHDPVTNGTACDNATVCDGRETCQAGTCTPGTAPTVNDGNVCTTDTCDAVTGVHHVNNTDPCATDNNECTTDVCSGGACTHPNKPDKTICGNQTPEGVCDQADQCLSGQCSVNRKDAGTVCRPAASDCDIADKCTGVDITCSADATSCQPKDTPKIEPTGTTCQQFRDGTVQPLTAALYTLKSGKINSMSPGVFFVYDTVHLSATGSITVTESSILPNGIWTARIGVNQKQVLLYDLNCNLKKVGTLSIDPNGNVTITNVPSVPTGAYILSVKYDPTTLSGYTPPTTSTTYKFQVQAGGASSGSASVLVTNK